MLRMCYCVGAIVLTSSAIGCTSDGGGEGSGASSTSTTTSSATSSTSTTTSGADDTTGGDSCMDALGNNGTLPTAYDLTQHGDVANPDFRHAVSAQICPGESDFFRYAPPCTGYLGVEVIVDEDGDDVTLLLRDSMGTELQRSEGNPALVWGAFRMEALHRVVDTDEVFIEVVHEAGDQVPYTITTYFLPSGSCLAASWSCEATSSLVATETSCTAEPSSGSCPPTSRTTTNVALPIVGSGMSAFSGWLVHTAADAIDYHARPTTHEHAAIVDLCEAACEAQWNADPDVAANCGGTGVFEAPSVFAKPSYPALAAIPAMVRDGSGIFGTEALSCNLHDSCCKESSTSRQRPGPSTTSCAGPTPTWCWSRPTRRTFTRPT
jgi:hypothetical protein